MNIARLKNFFFLLVVLFVVQASFAQLSKTHYIPPLTAADNDRSEPGDQYFYISTPSSSDVTYVIKPVGLSSTFWTTGTVTSTTPQTIDLDPGGNGGYGQLFVDPVTTSYVHDSRGYIVEATDLIYVSVRLNSNDEAQAGALVSKGLSALGTEFRVGNYTNENPKDDYLNFVSVMATEDDTQVTFDDLPAGLVIENYSGSFPITPSTLNKGDSYTIATYSNVNTTNRDGLIGTLVTSNNPIVVNCGSTNGSFHHGGGRDYGIDQIVGHKKIGTEYIFVRGFGDNEWEKILIVAHEDNTSIYVNGNTTLYYGTINSGEYIIIEGNDYGVDGNMYVESTKPVYAYQGVGGLDEDGDASEANQGMFFVPPLSCETKGNVDNIANIDEIGSTPYSGGVSIVTKKGATVTINKSPLTSYTTEGPYDVPGNTAYETYKITGLAGETISVECDNELYCAYFNYSGAATSGSFYSGFPTAPEIAYTTDLATLGECIPNLTLEAINMNSFDTTQWYFDDGSGYVAIGPSDTATLKPVDPGTYKLVGITCTGEEIPSEEIPVSICPDDTDNDGIINDLDIDNDNDGILNCTESYGDQIIDLSTTTSGTLPEGSYSFTGTTSTIGNTSNNITGATDSTFKSDVLATTTTTESSVTYSLNFNSPLNLQFKLPSSAILGNSTLNDDEVFIVQVSSAKTITLVDSDDQLLVDTNYDGEYESGITQFSSNEIRFKINGTSLASGSATFNFYASMVDYFSYTHQNNSTTSSTSAVFKIKATCLPIDSDGDGITDEFDYDSDNDGIPDRSEGTGTSITLSGNDSNNDGLDDIFDSNATPIDTDNDGVFDYLDLDSDNDGIYDLEESGSGLTDTDFDGIIDNILSTIGLNGWDDTVETSPDSGDINYTITDTDNDTLLNYTDSDSDGDNCSDVIEAGFSDGNSNDYLGDSNVVVDTNGVVTNASDGYTSPDVAYITSGLITIIDQPLNTEICELETTTLTIETNVIDSYQWQVSTDGVNWNDIVDDIVYSNSTTNELTITAVPLTYTNSVYRVVLSKSNNICGLISDEVVLIVHTLPNANPVVDLELCDDDTDGDDTNGIVQSFDLETQTSTILGTQLPSDFTVTYYESQTEANTGTNALASPYTNSSNPQTIYVRVENNTAGCFVTNLNFDLIVNALPTANSTTDIVECDDSTDGDSSNGIIQTFDLDSQTSTILGTQLATEYTVSYHLNQSDADLGLSSLTSPYTNISNPQTVFVRVENNTTGCLNTDLTYDLIVNLLPIANPVTDLELCDNLDDGNDTNEIVQTFDLDSQTNTILGAQLPSEYTVTYHLNETAAISGSNALSSPYTNTSSPQTIYVRVLNNTTNCINTSLSFDLIVHPLPTITNSVTLKQCDNDTDGFSYFNLTEANDEISTNAANETITYYLNETEAISQSNPITNPTTFENRTVNSDIVWANVASTNNCSRVAEIQLLVSTTGIPSTDQWYFYQCDDFLDENGDDTVNNDNRDGIATFDFSTVDDEVRAIFPSGQKIIITYYRNEDDALAEENAITDISNYRNIGYPNTQNIYVRVDSEIDNDCLGFGDHITLTVEALPIANPVTIDRQCDDDDDGQFPFDTSLIEATVIGTQSNVVVSYFDEAGNSLKSPLPNPFLTTSQTIRIQVANTTTLAPDGPCYDETTLEFIVDDSPVAYPVTVAPVCDDESNDGIYDFDTSTIQSTILGSQTGMQVLYFDADGNDLASPLPNPFTTKTQTISVQVINPLNSICIANSTIDFEVYPLPSFEVITPQTICITDPASTITLEIYPDDTSAVYEYDWTNASGTTLSTNETLDVSEPGTYTIRITDGVLCATEKSIVVNASIIATITQNDIIVEDDSNNNTITILTDNLGIGDYEYALDNDYGYQDEPFFDYVEAGIHTIYVRDKNNCGTAQIEVSIIGFPKFFTPNNDGYNDTWNILGLDSNYYPSSIIYIFDRYGKLITTINPEGNGWNGYYNGEILPSTDYWFSIELTNIKGETSIRKGHFSLIRRQ